MSLTARHAQITLQRARVLAPLIVLAQLMALVTSRDSGIPLTSAIVAINLIVMATGAILAAALWARRVPERAANPVATFLLWSPMITSLCSFIVTEREPVLLLLLLEQVIGAAMINGRWLVAGYLVFDVAWAGAASQLEPERGKFAVRAVIVAQLFAFVLHRLMVHSLDQAEHQRVAAETRLAELERSETARAELAEQLVHAQRLEAVGTLAAGLAHDMNNVLAAIMGLSDAIAESGDDEQVRQDARDILHEAERGAKLTRNLLSFSRRGQYRREVMPVSRVVDETVALIRRTLPKTVELVTTGAGEETIEGDPAQLGQAIVNLCINASDAMTGRGTLDVGWDTVEIAAGSPVALPPRRYVRIRVTDTGSGMDEPTRARVFEPFFTTKPQGKGTGLGLALVWGVVTKARGTVTVDSVPGVGSTFTLYLPVSSRAALPPVAIAPRTRVAAGGTVLVIDDEQAVRTATSRMLDELGLRSLAVDGGVEGLAVYDRHRADVELVVLDMAMPGMSGAEVFAQLRMRSDVPIVIATGYAVESEVQRLVEAGARVLEKPYRMAALQHEVERVFVTRAGA